MIQAKIIADSEHAVTGQRITTVIVTLPRIVLAELNTHRMFSRNSASSRAIPAEKMIERIKTDPFIPLRFQKTHKGMQGTEYLEGEDEKHERHNWEIMALNAAAQAERMNRRGVTKQLINRILEPYMWHTVMITATEWDNFFALRDHEAAEIHIAEAARQIWKAMTESTPRALNPGQLHIPFGDHMDESRIWDIVNSEEPHRDIEPAEVHYGTNTTRFEEIKLQIAVARCARLSYINYEGNDDYDADLKLHDNLMKMGHWSPFEHVGRAMTDIERQLYTKTVPSDSGRVDSIKSKQVLYGWSRNFRDFVQHRQLVDKDA